MRKQRANGQPRNVYEYQCDECGNNYEIRRQTEDKREKKFGHNVCMCCTQAKHKEAEERSDRLFPSGLRGSKDIFEFECEVCGDKWETKGATAEVSFYKSDRMFLCTGCKYDKKHWNEKLVEVSCSKCDVKYSVSKKTISERPDPSNRICCSCSNKGKALTEETKKKISEKNTGYKHTDQSKKLIRERSSQPDIVEHLKSVRVTWGMKDKEQSQETKDKRAEANRGQKRTQEFKDRMREHRLAYIERCGGQVLPETSAKMSRVQIELRMNGFNPARGHRQETYHSLKPQPAFLKPKKRPYVLSSSWESFYARWLDSNSDVVSWTYEAMKIDLPGGKIYLTDFIWEDVDEQVYVIEVKPRRKVEHNIDGAQVKLEALTDFCAMMTEQTDRLWVGMLVDEDALEAIGFTFDISK